MLNFIHKCFYKKNCTMKKKERWRINAWCLSEDEKKSKVGFYWEVLTFSEMLLARVSGIQYGSTETFWHRKKKIQEDLMYFKIFGFKIWLFLGISDHFSTENQTLRLDVILKLLQILLIFLVWIFGLKMSRYPKTVILQYP